MRRAQRENSLERQRRERAEDVAHCRMQGTKPQTVAHGLTDSPAGLAARIVDCVPHDRSYVNPLVAGT